MSSGQPDTVNRVEFKNHPRLGEVIDLHSIDAAFCAPHAAKSRQVGSPMYAFDDSIHSSIGARPVNMRARGEVAGQRHKKHDRAGGCAQKIGDFLTPIFLGGNHHSTTDYLL